MCSKQENRRQIILLLGSSRQSVERMDAADCQHPSLIDGCEICLAVEAID